MEEMFIFRNEVRQARHKCNKREGSTKTESHKLDKRHKSDKHQPIPKRPRYEHYTPLTTNHTIILEEAFNLEVPFLLPPMKPPKPRLDAPNTADTIAVLVITQKIVGP